MLQTYDPLSSWI